jgi:hypothetical protein
MRADFFCDAVRYAALRASVSRWNGSSGGSSTLVVLLAKRVKPKIGPDR